MKALIFFFIFGKVGTGGNIHCCVQYDCQCSTITCFGKTQTQPIKEEVNPAKTIQSL